MAYALDEDTEEQAQQKPGAAQVPTGIQAAQGQPQTGGGSATPGSKFIGFDQYLQANQGAAQQSAQKLAGDVQQRGQAAMGAVKGAAGNFMGQVFAGTPVTSNRPAPTTAAEAESQASATQYKGPTSFRDFAGPGLYTQVQEAGDYTRALGTEGGRQALLEKGQPATYSGAQSRMDAALTGAVPAASRYVELQKKYGETALGQYLGAAENVANLAAGQQAKIATDESARLKGLVPGLKAQDDQAARDAQARSTEARDAATVQRNETKRGEYLASGTPASEQVYSTTDDQAALRYGDKVYNAWVAAGRPEFSGWIRSRRR